ncbi:MAG TPA: long-chain N-acyl amino acid synthase [Burkholderiaceae bacterium]|nr:long-chain N-acyl amino acid synthase [Burkholderiaceae bacterium]
MTTSHTIIGAPFESRMVSALAGDPSGLALLSDGSGPRLFKIRAADSHGHRSSANILIKRRYGWRGYHAPSLPSDQSTNRITLSATEQDEAIGTITIVLDSDEGLAAEDVFGEEVAALRSEGQRICEFTKLAMDPITGSKRVLASLFHVAYLLAHRIRRYDTLLIEVNPRHVAYYRRMLGCTVLSGPRMNPRVNAPAVLLHLDFNYTREQIGKFGGQPELASMERSLYPYAFSLSEEAGIIGRLNKADWSMTSAKAQAGVKPSLSKLNVRPVPLTS